MKFSMIIAFMILPFAGLKAQATADKKSNDPGQYKVIIFNGTWELDSIISRKLFRSKTEPYDQAVIYNFSNSGTLTCYKSNQQTLPCKWDFTDSNKIRLTFLNGDATTQWMFWRVSHNKLIVKNYLPSEIDKATGKVKKFKYNKQMFILTRVKDSSCK